MARPSIAVVGPGESASSQTMDDAREVGRLVAEHRWITLTGGRALGVMAAAIEGASRAGGVTIGILPGRDRRDAAPGCTVAIPTGLGEARNVVLVTAADAVIGCGMSPGAASEVALALQAGRPTVLVRPTNEVSAFFRDLSSGAVGVAADPAAAIMWLEDRLVVAGGSP